MLNKKLIISPPFGNYIRRDDCISVIGSLTWEARPGLVYNVLKSFRPYPGGWINKIGLRNKGLQSISSFNPERIYSLVGLLDGDWEKMMDYCPKGLTIEVNLGCPNVHEYGIPIFILKEFCDKFNVIAKLSPDDRVYDMADMCMKAGAKLLHCSNTLPMPEGGVSGFSLAFRNIPIVMELAEKYPGKIIAGGGIYNTQALNAYARAGASYFSLSTVYMTPWRVKGIVNHSATWGIAT